MSLKIRLNRLERELKRLSHCEVCGDAPRTVDVAREGDSYDPPAPCRGCGSTRFVIVVAGFLDPLSESA